MVRADQRSVDHLAGPSAQPDIQVEVVFAAAPGELQRCTVVLKAGATAADALRACGLPVVHQADLLDTLSLGVWGRTCTADQTLREGDRLELCRPLQVDPKEARRQRFRRDGVRKRAPIRRVR